MHAKSALYSLLLLGFLTACQVTTPIPVTVSPITPTSTPCEICLPSTTSSYAAAITPSITPMSNNLSVLTRADEVIRALKDQDFISLSGYVHPLSGVRFSPYAFVRVTDQVFSAVRVAGMPVDSRVYTWGNYSGSGAAIDHSIPDYYSQFIYDVDFANAPQLALNRRLGVSTSMDNSLEFYPGAMTVEYHFPGFDPQYQGMDWRSLRLVFTEYNSIWYLVGIIHDQWTS